MQGHKNFFEISNPDIIYQHLKIPYCSVILKLFTILDFFFIFGVPQQKCYNSESIKARTLKFFLQLFQSFSRSCKNHKVTSYRSNVIRFLQLGCFLRHSVVLCTFWRLCYVMSNSEIL